MRVSWWPNAGENTCRNYKKRGVKRDSTQLSTKPANGKIENFIGLASAFSLERFRKHNNPFYEDIYYQDYCPSIKRFVFTASDSDSAFFPVFWSESVGDYEFMRKYCNAEQPVSVNCSEATQMEKSKACNRAQRLITSIPRG